MKIKNIICSVALILLLVSSCKSPANTVDNNQVIAFGSCSREDSPNQLWSEIRENSPEVFIWGGDNIYGDSEDMNVLRTKYEKQKNHNDYQSLLNEVKIIGTWDDHDYGVNDGGSEFIKKKESKEELIRFLEPTRESSIYDHEGVYQSYTYSINGSDIKAILLDTRYFRDPLLSDTTSSARYYANETGDVLGEEQWEWLENELSGSTARLNLIVSSIQVIPTEQGYEKWANFPDARDRFFKLVTKYPDKKVLILSGDRHIAEYSKIDLPGLEYPLVDFTSSGLTHSWGEPAEEPNQFRMGAMVFVPNFGIIRPEWDKKTLVLEVRGEDNTLLASHSIIYPNL